MSRPDASTLSQLRDLQRLMAGAIMHPLTPQNRMQLRWKDGRRTSDVAATFIKPNDRLTSFERLEIYNRQYWFRLLDCFYEDFPGLRAVIGERKFMKLAESYIERYPSQSFTLRNLGSRLETFLGEESRWTASHNHQLALDTVRFEWAQIEAFDGEARPILTKEDLEGKDPSRLRLKLQPYLQLLEFEYPVDDFLIAIKKRESSLRSEASNAMNAERKTTRRKKTPLPKPQKTFVAVHRMNHVIYFKNLEPEAYRILLALKKGVTLKAACAAAFSPNNADMGKKIERVQRWFQNWMSLGWFCK